MNELKEIFDMVTKQTEPDLDSWKDQEDRQRRRRRNRRLGAYAVAAAVVVVAAVAAVAIETLREGQGDQREPAVSRSVAPDAATAVTHYFVDIATGERQRVPADMTGGRLFTVSPDGQAIAYNTCCTGNDSVYVANLDGSDARPVTTPPLNSYGATWVDASPSSCKDERPTPPRSASCTWPTWRPAR